MLPHPVLATDHVERSVERDETQLAGFQKRNASTSIRAPVDDGLPTPLTRISAVWLPLSAEAAHTTCAAWVVPLYRSRDCHVPPSRRAIAVPLLSPSVLTNATSDPVNVNVATLPVAPVLRTYPPEAPDSATRLKPLVYISEDAVSCCNVSA